LTHAIKAIIIHGPLLRGNRDSGWSPRWLKRRLLNGPQHASLLHWRTIRLQQCKANSRKGDIAVMVPLP